MEQDEYGTLVTAAEAEVARDPVALRRRVQRFVAFGYLYVLGVIGIVAGGLVLVVVAALNGTSGGWAVKLAFALAALLVVILRSLYVKIATPTGTPVSPEDAARLHERVEEIRRAVDAPAPDVILLNEEFNAAVTEVPEMGIAGARKRYLIIGVPLLYALGPDEFDAVLAHEFGHLSGSHPKHGLRVWRMAHIWLQLMTQLEEKQSFGSVLFDRFFHWYVPRLYAYGFAMSRGDEYEADADAARVTSPAAMGGALAALAVRGRFFEEVFWTEVWTNSAEHPEPTDGWRLMPRRLRESDQQADRREWIASALLAKAGHSDTHPSLGDRLAHLGLVRAADDGGLAAVDQLLTPMQESAADRYFPELASSGLEALEIKWRTSVSPTWTERFNAARESRAKLAELSARDLERGDLSAEERWEVAWRTSLISGDDAAVEATRRSLAANEANPHAHFLLGRALKARRDDECEVHFRRAMELDPEATPAVAQMLLAIYQLRGDNAAQQQVHQQYDAWAQMMQEAQVERQAVQPQDRFDEPQLEPEEIAAIQDAIDSTSGLRDALVARKITKHLPNRPVFVILLRKSRLRWAPRDLVKRFLAALKLERDVIIHEEGGVFTRLAPVLDDGGAIRLSR